MTVTHSSTYKECIVASPLQK